MIEQDTVKLLRECDAGVKMGISSIDDVIEYVSDKNFKNDLMVCRQEHEKLNSEIQQQLDNSDGTVADLITDGCNMGVKSLNRYLNEYKAADEVSKDICKRLINQEEQLGERIRCYL